MPRTTTKIDLIKVANEQFDKLWKMIDTMSEEEQSAGFCFNADALTVKDGAAHWKRDKNLRDVLTHLYEWHQLLIEWERTNSSGGNKSFLPEPYTWKNYGEMNIVLWQKHQSTPLIKAKEMLRASHKAVIAAIEKYTDEQLFVKSYYNWTGSTSLGQYINGPMVSHYDWAMKKLKEQKKA